MRSWRGVSGLVLALALIGGLAGYAWAESRSDVDLEESAPAPVAAAEPAVPFTPPEKVNPDSDLPPVAEDLEVEAARVGTPQKGGIEVPVPADWERTDLAGGMQSRWSAPGSPDGAYSVRVQVVDQPRSLAQSVAERAAALPLDPRVTDVEILQQTGDTLIASFIISGYRVLQVVRWVSLDGSTVDVEISASGRVIDQPGLEALVARMATGVRRQPPTRSPEPAQ
jgi:hypothetical protein